MAEIKNIAKFIFKWEGGFSNHPADRGGATNRGVILEVWKKKGWDKNGDGKIDVADLKLITEDDALVIMKGQYWDRWQADKIQNQLVANTLVDWVWLSGAWGIKIPQRMLGLKEDGIVGPKTLEAVNNAPKDFLEKLYKRRYDFINSIAKNNPTQKVFLKGWLNRMDDLVRHNKEIALKLNIK